MPGTDGVTAIRLCGGRGQIEFRLIIGMDSIERLALLDPVADLAEQSDAGALVEWRPCGAGEAVQLEAVDLGDRAVVRGGDIEGQLADVVAAGGGTLRVNNILHFLERRAVVEQFAG